MSNAILAITDGMLRYSLITRPWWLEDWIPQDAALKGGGIRRGSPLSDGTRLVDFSYANVIDTFLLKVMHGEQDGAIRNLQDMKRLLEKGRRYWTDDWATEPVWIEARGSDETNIRYAVIKNWSLPQGSNPYAQPFFPQQQEAVMEGLALTLEHDFWQAEEPGSATTVEVAAQQDYNGTTYGRAATTSLEIYIANKSNVANVTDIYTWTSPAGPFSANLIGAALPFNLLAGGAPGPANGDITYFGIDTTLPDGTGPFVSLVFDIVAAVTYGAGDSIDWEYWTGGAWAALPNHDNTDSSPGGTGFPWLRVGVNSLHWIPPANWAEVAVNGVFGFWIRVVVTEATGIGRAEQQNRDVYTITWPRCDVDELQVAGDLPALIQLTVEGQSDDWVGADLDATINRVMVGLRSTSRDVSTADPFEAFINFADNVLNPWTIVLATGRVAPADDIQAPTGRVVAYTGIGVQAMTDEFAMFATNPVPDSYVGEFHCFLRYKVSAGSDGDLRARVRFASALTATTLLFETETFDLLAESDWIAADLGRVVLPPGGGTDPTWLLYIIIRIEGISAAARDATFYDLVLIPVDEWMGDYQENITPSSAGGAPLGYNMFLLADATSIPKDKLAAPIRRVIGGPPTTFALWNRFTAFAAGPPILQANANQRLWFFLMRSANLTDLPRYSDPWLAARLQIVDAERYQSMRGAR